MRYISYCFSTLLLLFFLSSCGSESTPVYNLTTTPTPDEAGSVSPTSGEYDEGETIEISATPNADWVFDSWEGDASGSENPTTITMNSDKDIAATFVVREYPLTVEIQGEGTVQEEIIQEKTTDYPAETTVELTAEPADGWKFVEWQGDLEGDENPQQITVDDEKTVTAVFEEVYNLTVSSIGEGNVIIDPEREYYFVDSNVVLTAEAANSWKFDEWQGDISSTENPIELTIDGSTDVSAKFSEIPVTDVSLDINEETIFIDDTLGLNATVSPEDAFNKNVIWRSSDSSIATVNDTGRVTGIDEGIVTITAETEDGAYTDEAEIKVESYYKEIGESYEAPDGLTVTLNSLEFTDHGNYYEYNINYTLKNNTDSIIDEGQFIMHYEDGQGTENQFGFFGSLTPGEEMTRSYTWDIDDTEPLFEELEYNNVFDSYDDPLMWKVDTN